jgi:copper chaperone NosL
MKQVFFFLSMMVFCISCTVSPAKIEYGKDACSFCDMTIVDKTHAAQVVTKKGKPYKYDAVECLINDLAQKKENSFAYILATDFSIPEKLIPVKTATFLISTEIKSPMGANLSVFANKEQAKHFKGKLFNWEGIKQEIRN